MARHVNPSFVGVSNLDVDPNSISRTRIIDEAIADTALVHDLVTGKNSPPAVLDHSGPGNGCVLGLPVVSQICDNYHFHIDGEESAYNEETSLWQVAAIQPAGETSASITFDFSAVPEGRGERAQFEVLTMAGAVIGSSTIFGNNTVATVEGLTPGTIYLYRIRHRWASLFGKLWAYGFTMGFFRRGSTNLIRRTPSDVEDSTELNSQTVSTAVVIDQHDFETAEATEEGLAISGYHATELAHNQHALEEFITGGPAGTNQARVLVPSVTQGAYYDHSRLGAEFSAMPLLKRFPVGGGSFGPAPLDGGGGEDGAGGWSESAMLGCPGWARTATDGTYYPALQVDTWLPRHGPNNLGFILLAYSPDASMGGLTVRCRLSIYNSISAGLIDQAVSSTWTQIGGTKWWVWTASSLDHLPEKSNLLYLEVSMTAGSPKANGGSFRLAGWTASLEG